MTTLSKGLTDSQRDLLQDYDPFGLPEGMDPAKVGPLDPLQMETAYGALECRHSSMAEALRTQFPDIQYDPANDFTIAEVREGKAPFVRDRVPNGNEAVKREWKYLISTLPKEAKIQVIGEKVFVYHKLVADNSVLTVYDLSETVSGKSLGLKVDRSLQVGDAGDVLDLFALAKSGTQVYMKRKNIVIRLLQKLTRSDAYATSRLVQGDDGTAFSRITTHSLDGFTTHAMLHEIEHTNHQMEMQETELGSGKTLDTVLSAFGAPINLGIESAAALYYSNPWYMLPYLIAQIMLYKRSRDPNTYIGSIFHKKVSFERRAWMGMELLRLMLENNGIAVTEGYQSSQDARYNEPFQFKGGPISHRYQPLVWVIIDTARRMGKKAKELQPRPAGAGQAAWMGAGVGFGYA